MLKIGLTGGIASGKSTVAQLFEHYDIPIIDADIIARQLVKPKQAAFDEIVQLFGQHIVQADGTLNRKSLRQLIFSDNAAKQQLEHILHPKIRQQFIQQSNQQRAPYCIVVIPLLVEANMKDIVDRVLVVDLEPKQQFKRLCERDDISQHDAQLIINNQCNRQQRLDVADDVINNNSSPEHLSQTVTKLHQKYCALAKTMSINS